MASRYNSFDSRFSASSLTSDPPSAERYPRHAIVKSKLKDVTNSKRKNKTLDYTFSDLMKKMTEKKSESRKKDFPAGLVLPYAVADELKGMHKRGNTFGVLQKKLFGKGSKEANALPVPKNSDSTNVRTLATVLKSERELLAENKKQELKISELILAVEDKNREVDMLKDLCMKQRDEISALKNTILFPNMINPQELFQKEGSGLKQTNNLIPSLQQQVTSLTSRLQCLAEDLAEVKADRKSSQCSNDYSYSPLTPACSHEAGVKYLVSNSSDAATYDSLDDMFLNDLNPCLTPFSVKTKSEGDLFVGENGFSFTSDGRKLSKSSGCYS